MLRNRTVLVAGSRGFNSGGVNIGKATLSVGRYNIRVSSATPSAAMGVPFAARALSPWMAVGVCCYVRYKLVVDCAFLINACFVLLYYQRLKRGRFLTVNVSVLIWSIDLCFIIPIPKVERLLFTSDHCSGALPCFARHFPFASSHL